LNKSPGILGSRAEKGERKGDLESPELKNLGLLPKIAGKTRTLKKEEGISFAQNRPTKTKRLQPLHRETP